MTSYHSVWVMMGNAPLASSLLFWFVLVSAYGVCILRCPASESHRICVPLEISEGPSVTDMDTDAVA